MLESQKWEKRFHRESHSSTRFECWADTSQTRSHSGWQGTWMAGPEAHWGRRGLWGDQSLIKTELVENKSAHGHRWVQDCVCACGSQQWLHTYRTIQTHEWVSIHSCTPLKMSTICSTDFVHVTVYWIPMTLAGIICLMEYDSPIFGI